MFVKWNFLAGMYPNFASIFLNITCRIDVLGFPLYRRRNKVFGRIIVRFPFKPLI